MMRVSMNQPGLPQDPMAGDVEMLSSKAVQALFDGIIMGTNRCAEREWDQSIVIDQEEDDINLGVRAARLTTPLHISDWAKAQKEDPELGAAIAWLKWISCRRAVGPSIWPN